MCVRERTKRKKKKRKCLQRFETDARGGELSGCHAELHDAAPADRREYGSVFVGGWVTVGVGGHACTNRQMQRVREANQRKEREKEKNRKREKKKIEERKRDTWSMTMAWCTSRWRQWEAAKAKN